MRRWYRGDRRLVRKYSQILATLPGRQGYMLLPSPMSSARHK